MKRKIKRLKNEQNAAGEVDGEMEGVSWVKLAVLLGRPKMSSWGFAIFRITGSDYQEDMLSTKMTEPIFCSSVLSYLGKN